MLKVRFDLKQSYPVVIYRRMSTKAQNPRSPQQQQDAIEQEMRRQGVPWKVVKVYTDSGISGRYRKRRPAFTEMVSDLRSKKVRASLIVVDTFERLSRDEESLALREQLKKYGVLVVTADSHFTDPTSLAGKALGMAESIRSSAVNEVKAGDVDRGKRDTFEEGYWAGGAVPFGYMLEDAVVVTCGVSYLHHRLVRDPATDWIVAKIFDLADTLGAGANGVTKLINADPQVPGHLKPLSASRVRWILRNEIYTGLLIWGRHCTDIVNDTRVLHAVPLEEQTRVENFCPAIVTKEQFDRVNALREARGNKQKAARAAKRDPDAIPGLRAPGIPLLYPLAGLVRCGLCRRSMAPVSSSPYVTLAGEERRYVYYACPGNASGDCPNNHRVSEQWLRETVMALLVERVFFGQDWSAA
jgi:DNA invertase Pin-like site-specific DNA recombinase